MLRDLLEGDHVEEQCALYSPASRRPAPLRRSVGEKAPSDFGEPVTSVHGKGASRMACFACNQGECRFPACKYQNFCVQCSGDHWIAQCPWLRKDREGRSPRSQPQAEGR